MPSTKDFTILFDPEPTIIFTNSQISTNFFNIFVRLDRIVRSSADQVQFQSFVNSNCTSITMALSDPIQRTDITLLKLVVKKLQEDVNLSLIHI